MPISPDDFIKNLHESIIDDKVEDAHMHLDEFLDYARTARQEWETETYLDEQKRFRDLIDQKLVAEYPDEIARQKVEVGIRLEFPELFEIA